MIQGIDLSNYSSPLTDSQVAYIKANMAFVIIGLQDSAKARAFQAQLPFIHKDYYLDRPNRNLSMIEPGATVWVDVEVGCFTDEGDIDQQLAQLSMLGFASGIYGNPTSIQPVIGSSAKYAHLPLWYANYRVPDWNNFTPFNGWVKPLIWQYSSSGVMGINCDLNEAEGEWWKVEAEQPVSNADQLRLMAVQAVLTKYDFKVAGLNPFGQTVVQLLEKDGTVAQPPSYMALEPLK